MSQQRTSSHMLNSTVLVEGERLMDSLNNVNRRVKIKFGFPGTYRVAISSPVFNTKEYILRILDISKKGEVVYIDQIRFDSLFLKVKITEVKKNGKSDSCNLYYKKVEENHKVVISEDAKTTITIGAFLLCIVLFFALGTTRSAYLLVPIATCFITAMFTSSQGYIDPPRGSTGEGHYADPTGKRTSAGLWVIGIGATLLTILQITLINVLQLSTTVGRLGLDLKGFAGPFFVVAIVLGLLVTVAGRR